MYLWCAIRVSEDSLASPLALASPASPSPPSLPSPSPSSFGQAVLPVAFSPSSPSSPPLPNPTPSPLPTSPPSWLSHASCSCGRIHTCELCSPRMPHPTRPPRNPCPPLSHRVQAFK